MGIFNLFRRRKPAAAAAGVSAPAHQQAGTAPPAMSSAELLEAITDAHARQDATRLHGLLAAYGPQISAQCLDWSQVPTERREDDAWIDRHIQALGFLCELMKRSGDARLYDKLVGATEQDNPLLRWDRALESAREPMESIEAYDEAIRRLEDALIDNRDLRGTALRFYVPVTHGLLGSLFFHSGRAARARGHFETALRLCREHADAEGVRAYTNSLHDLHRYLGDASAAADYAEQHAAALDAQASAAATANDPAAAAMHASAAAEARRRAALVRAGEPALRAVVTVGGGSDEADSDAATGACATGVGATSAGATGVGATSAGATGASARDGANRIGRADRGGRAAQGGHRAGGADRGDRGAGASGERRREGGGGNGEVPEGAPGPRRYELDDVPPGALRDGKVQFLFERNRPSIRLAETLARRGAALGGAGKYYEALAEFRAAVKIDPHDPQPHYEACLCLMHLQRYAEASDEAAASEAAAPGWFNARADGWMADQLAAGRWPRSTFAAVALEDVGPPALALEEKLAIADAVVAAAPDSARGHLLRGRTLEALDRDDDARDAYRAGLACDAEEDLDTRTRLLMQLAVLTEAEDEKRSLFAEAAALASSGNLMAAAMSRVILASMSSPAPAPR